MEDKQKNYFVAYLDVMGFTEMVSSDNTNKIDLYVHTIENEILTLLKTTFTTIEFFTISDTIVLLSEYNSGDPNVKIETLRKLLMVVQEVQVILAKKNIWIRGAVSSGLVWFDKTRNILIGKGYINAYNLEKEALYPRVIIDPKIILELNSSGSGMKLTFNDGNSIQYSARKKLLFSHIPANTYQNLEKFIEEDAIFVDYGYLLVKNIDTDGWRDLFSNIKNNLYSNQKTYNKFLWLKRYFAHCFLEAEHNASLTADPNRKGFIHSCYSQMTVI